MPTAEEYESLPQLVLTSEEPANDPYDTSMAKHEDALAKAVLETGDRIGALSHDAYVWFPILC
jgi:hypothetical protein